MSVQRRFNNVVEDSLVRELTWIFDHPTKTEINDGIWYLGSYIYSLWSCTLHSTSGTNSTTLCTSQWLLSQEISSHIYKRNIISNNEVNEIWRIKKLIMYPPRHKPNIYKRHESKKRVWFNPKLTPTLFS